MQFWVIICPSLVPIFAVSLSLQFSFFCSTWLEHLWLPLMAQDTVSGVDSPRGRLLRDQVQVVKKKDSDRYEIVPIQDSLSFEKGFFIFIRACQLLAQKNNGIILVGVAGPSGAGKTVFTEKVLNFMPSIAVITMDNYNDSSRIIDGNFDGKFSLLLFTYT